MFAGEEVSSSPTVQTIDTPPIASVETLGVWKRGWTRENAFGSAPQLAIEIVVRAVGRIVVWVDAEADVRTEKSRNFCNTPDPNTLVPSGLRMSLALSPRNLVPASACAAVATSR